MAPRPSARHRASPTRTALARKRKELLGQIRAAVAKAQVEATTQSKVNVGGAATQLRAELAGLAHQINGAAGAGPQAAARALADFERSLAAIQAAAHISDHAQAMAELESGYTALVNAKHAAKRAGNDWPL